MKNKPPLLQTAGLSKFFGGLAAVNELDLTISEGEIFGLIGPNGAGKTTVFNLISGVLKPTGGRIHFNKDDITDFNPDKVAGKGLVRTFQANVLFREFSVMDNILLGCQLQVKTGVFMDLLNIRSVRDRRKKLGAIAEEVIEFVGLKELRQELAKNLAHGYQRILGIGIALAAHPKMILLDEPVCGMNNEEKTEMMALIQKIRVSGITVLLVEHDMRVVMGICDRIAVINFGTKIAEGPPWVIQEDEQVIEAYLGAEE
ncbi:MAG: ABC transporter ATP-binding protein [Deltaproteobacteria bacterium]|nr:ABC transporter ATP-binding protein [Deltaproteobacteria bacterium]